MGSWEAGLFGVLPDQEAHSIDTCAFLPHEIPRALTASPGIPLTCAARGYTGVFRLNLERWVQNILIQNGMRQSEDGGRFPPEQRPVPS